MSTRSHLLDQMGSALTRGGYRYTDERSYPLGLDVNVRARLVEGLGEHTFLVVLSTQAEGGTTDQKVPFKVLALEEMLSQGPEWERAYLVLGGGGTPLWDFYVAELPNKMAYDDKRIRVMHLSEWETLARAGNL